MNSDLVGVVLAAGRGSRLAPLTDTTPKPLVSVAGRACLDYALEALVPVVSEIVVVVGHLGEKIRAWLDERRLPVPVHIATNPAPEQGNLASLHSARRWIEGRGFVLTNADHLFPGDFFTARFPEGSGVRIAAQKARPILEDEMKIRVDAAERLRAISKQLTPYDGAYIGATRVAPETATAYWRAFERIRQEAAPETACVEDVLRALANGYEAPLVVWCDDVRWYEIDTPEDLHRAEEALAS